MLSLLHAHIVLDIDVTQAHADTNRSTGARPNIPEHLLHGQLTVDNVVVFHQRLCLGLQIGGVEGVIQLFVILERAPFALACRVVHDMDFSHAGFIIVPRQLDAVVHVTVDGRGVAVSLRRVLVDVERQEQALVGFEAQLAEIVIQDVHLAGIDDCEVGRIAEHIEKRSFLNALRDFVLGVGHGTNLEAVVRRQHFEDIGVSLIDIRNRVLVLEVAQLVIGRDLNQPVIRARLLKDVAVKDIGAIEPERHRIALVEVEGIVLEHRKR